MVLSDSHTISKSIDNDVKEDEIFDSINVLDHTRYPKQRRDRHVHKHRADDKDEFVKQPPDIFKETGLYSDRVRTAEVTTPIATTEHTKHHKSPKIRVGSFWRKFKGKDKKNNKQGSNERKRRIPINKKYEFKHSSTNKVQNSSPENKNWRKNKKQFTLRQPEINLVKRDVGLANSDASKTTNIPSPTTSKELLIGTAPPFNNTLKEKAITKPADLTTPLMEQSENLSELLLTMTTRISYLKEKYGLERYNINNYTISSSFGKSETNAQPTTTIEKTTEPYFAGTAEIEKLLNDAKFKAVQLLSKPNPLETDITNTVTAASLEAEPILTHVSIASPEYNLSTPISVNDITNSDVKRTVASTESTESNASNSVSVTNTESHHLVARSIKEDSMTLAHNVEDKLQKELKNIYNKMKHRVSSDIRKELRKTKSTLKEVYNKIDSKVTNKGKPKITPFTKPITTAKPKYSPYKSHFTVKEKNKDKLKFPLTTTIPRISREKSNSDKNILDSLATKDSLATNKPTPTYDDYMMLTLYEQMLAKIHEKYIRKLQTTTEVLTDKKRREHFRLSKRNAETLTEDIQNFYDDGGAVPDYDYIEPSANVSSTATHLEANPSYDNLEPTAGTKETSKPESLAIDYQSDMAQNKQNEESNMPENRQTVSTSAEGQNSEMSFEGLSNKISYNDFVNGYKHYLKFQREQGHQNFSNLVRYQAHRHHSVDDIGKFILNKIPTLPTERRKRFFDDTDIENQDITTKSDDNWFKKHFFLFIDNGPPKKFHNSQTVELKSAITETDGKMAVTDPMPPPEYKDQLYIRIGSDGTTPYSKDTSDLTLDDLTKILGSLKDKQSASPFFKGTLKHHKEILEPDSSHVYDDATDETMEHLKIIPQGFIDSQRREPKHIQTTISDLPAIEMLPQNSHRSKRTVTNVEDNTVIDDLINKELEEKTSTSPKVILPNAALRSSHKETNKFGYVDIDLVPRQTAVIKLRDNAKKSRFRNFFNKFNFKRNKNKNKQVKRSYNYGDNEYHLRRVRFNPFKKLKDIFGVKTSDKSGPEGAMTMPDYDMATSHFETLKPKKYDKFKVIDEMQKQIPNISEVVNYDKIMAKATTSASSALKLDDNDHSLLYSDHIIPSATATKEFSQHILSKVVPGVTQTATTMLPKTLTSEMIKEIPPTNVMTVHVKTIKPMLSPITTIDMRDSASTVLMTLDDMNFILNKIKKKLDKSTGSPFKYTTPFYKRGTDFDKKTLQLPLKGPLDELTIKSKLTRIAKFPISKKHFKIGRVEPPVVDIGKYMNLDGGPSEYIHVLRNRNVIPDMMNVQKENNLTKLSRPHLSNMKNKKKGKYNDYFNDLLMWHNDILNLDRVPNPSWKNILRDVQTKSDSYTTPDKNTLLRELDEMDDFLGEMNNNTKGVGAREKKSYYPISNRSDGKRLSYLDMNDEQGVIRSLAMDDSAFVTSKDFLIKGEAQFYQYNKPMRINSQLKRKAINKSKLNRMYLNDNDAKDYNKWKGAYRRPVDKEPAILVDTTIMAYDDEADTVAKSLDVKKLSRNSNTDLKHDHHIMVADSGWIRAAQDRDSWHSLREAYVQPWTHMPFLKTNKPPVQHYTTPLPMKSFEFNKFLKEHKMDVESVTSPMDELPTMIEHWHKEVRDHKYYKQPFVAETTSRIIGIPEKKQTKLESTKLATKALEESTRTTSVLMPKNLMKNKNNKKDMFIHHFDRNERYSDLRKMPRVATTCNNLTSEYNYYNIITNNMKDRPFEKKAPADIERQNIEFSLDPQNKEIEVTIINIDNTDVMTTNQPLQNYALTLIKKDDSDSIANFTERPEITSEITAKTLDFVMPKEEIHNGLLYKGTFKDYTTTPTVDLVSRSDVSKSTENTDPVFSDLATTTVGINRLRYPFDKITQMYPEFRDKISRGKSLQIPKRVHISSHHYKYDIFYDDIKKNIKTYDGMHPSPLPEIQNDIEESPMRRRTPSNVRNAKIIDEKFQKDESYKTMNNNTDMKTVLGPRNGETNTEVIQRIDRTARRNRHARTVSQIKGTHKRRLFTWRGCKPKPEGGLTAPGEELETQAQSSKHTTPRISTYPPETMTVYGATGTPSISKSISEVTPESISASTSEATSESTSESTPESTPEYTLEVRTQSGSLVYDLKHMKRNSSAIGDKDKSLDRHRRLYKLSALIHNRFRNLLKNKNFTSTVPSMRYTKRCPKSNTKCNCTAKASTNEKSEEMAENEEEEDNEELEDLKGSKITDGAQEYTEAYNEPASLHRPPVTTTTEEPDFFSKHYEIIKRDLQTQNTFTAKDVAALEVIVDLMKNTISYEEKDIGSAFQNNNVMPVATPVSKSVHRNDSSNSIQVHIAIPYNLQSGKKRSLFDPVRVRKVFSAKMSTPVDLEYQVQAFEGTVEPTSISTIGRTNPSSNSTPTVISSLTPTMSSINVTIDGLSPGMYLLVDKPKNGYALKPVKTRISLSDVKTRQVPVAVVTTASMSESKPTETREETTSLKGLGKVTLSKEFVAAINKQLLEIYENVYRAHKEVTNETRKARSIWNLEKIKAETKRKSKCTEKWMSKRRIDWEAVKKYFGHDRVCNCKCKANKTMCTACAASDAVIDELIFEFDNIDRYMQDHCTEIQTFFWMNPSGGQRLRESVSRIDKSLGDYYKRVKGKCQGRTCKTFVTYIDKRQIVKTCKVPAEDVLTHLINDLTTIAEDLNRTIALKTCFNNKLNEEGEKFIRIFKRFLSKNINKRSNTNSSTRRKLIKNVYSLDNINVNIICNAKATSITQVPGNLETTTLLSEHLFEYNIFEPNIKKRKGFKKLFPRKSKTFRKLFTYFVTDYSKRPKMQNKREINNRVATPLISDGGGAFWLDYLKAATNEPRVARDSLKEKSKIEIAVVQKGIDGEPKVQKLTDNKSSGIAALNTKFMSIRPSEKGQLQRETETTTDYLSQNINQLLQLFGSIQDIEAMNMHSNRSTMFLNQTLNNKEATDKISKSTKHINITSEMHYKSDDREKESTKAMSNSTIASPSITETQLIKNIEELNKMVSQSMETVAGKSKSSILKTDTTKMMSTKTTSPTTKSLTFTSQHTTSKITDAKLSNLQTKTTSAVSATQKTKMKLLLNDGEPLTRKTSPASFLGKLKTATLRFLKKSRISPATKAFSSTSTTKATSISASNIMDEISNIDLDMVEFEPASYKFTSMSPTIVIINECDKQIRGDILNSSNKDSNGYRNLLLSIIKYETNKLNDEWNRIAYGSDADQDEIENKRSERLGKIETTKTTKTSSSMKTSQTKSIVTKPLQDHGVIHNVTIKFLENLQLPHPVAKTKKPDCLLNKIVSKMGIKVVPNSKRKAVKKPTVREITKKKKLKGMRKLKSNEDPATPARNEKACDTRRTSETSRICDIQATFDHISDLQKTLPSQQFENLVKNVSCFKYKDDESNFYIPYTRKGKRWNWIRNKRCLKLHFSRIKDETDLDRDVDVMDFDDDNDLFETFVKGGNGIYKIIKRKKRTVNLETLDLGLRNIPSLRPREDEVIVMVGDTITLDCVPNTPVSKSESKFLWQTDRKRMLMENNVEMNGVKVKIQNVEPRNAGNYTCKKDQSVQRKVRLAVMTIPAFDVVFLPIYKTEEICSYDDLRAIQLLNTQMAEKTGCGKACSMRIDEPVCLRDRGTNSSLIRGTAVISLTVRSLNCSLECKRDIASSLVMLCASNTPILSSIGVVLSKDGVNETLAPWRELVRPVVTHTLRKKDTNGHREYHKLVSTLSPGMVDVVLICPAGYYLLQEYKLCSSCPPNTRSSRGDNTCTSCPRGTHAEPGAAACHAVPSHPRRYDWWWYPPCGYLLAGCSLMFGCTVCVLLSLIVHFLSRDTKHDQGMSGDIGPITPKTEISVTAAFTRTPHPRPLSPSRVILPRFFKPSLTSSRATDSQETKFELWKERNIPPPLPPIDFDF